MKTLSLYWMRTSSLIIVIFSMLTEARSQITGAFWEQRNTSALNTEIYSTCTNDKFLVGLAIESLNGKTSSSIVRSDDGENWYVVHKVFDYLNSLTYGQGKFLASSSNGKIYISSDGSNWINVQIPTSNYLFSVAWLGSRFAVCGSLGTLMTSADGLNWSNVTTNTSHNLKYVGVADDLCLAVGDNGIILQSTDAGVTWTHVPSVFTDNIVSVTSIPTGILFGTTSGLISWSSGNQWQKKYFNEDNPRASFYGYFKKFIKYDNYWIAHNGDDQISISHDGIVWHPYTVSSSDVIVFRGKLHFTGDTNARSQMGITFKQGVTDSSNTEALHSVIVQAGVFRAFGSAGTEYRSTNGYDWQNTSIQGFPYHRRSAVIRDDTCVVVGEGGIFTTTGFPIFTNFQSFNFGSSVDLLAVAKSPSQFIAVGRNGHIYRSTTGYQWQAVQSGTQETLTCAVWDGVRFHIMGYNGIYLSSQDGIVWIEHNNITNKTVRSLISTNQGLIAVGYNGCILTSSNGTDWTDRSLPATPNFHTIIQTDSGFLALGRNRATAWSDDATEWHLLPQNSVDTLDINAAVYHNGITVVACSVGVNQEAAPNNYSYGKLMYSNFNQSLETIRNTHPSFKTITQRSNQVIAAGEDGEIWTSQDDEKWTRQSPFGGGMYTDSLTVDGRTVLINTSGIVYSDNGENWDYAEIRNSDNIHPTSIDAFPRFVAYGNGKWVACGSGGLLTLSNDGVTWKIANQSPTGGSYTFYNDIEWGAGRFVVIGDNGMLAHSTDGEIWTKVTLPSGVSLSSLVWTGSQFIASRNWIDTSYVSSDGVNWTASAIANPPNMPISNRAFVNGRIFATTTSERISSTADMMNWTTHSYNTSHTYTSNTPGNYTVNDILWSGDNYVAIGNAGLIMTSPDAIHWTYRKGGMSVEFSNVFYINDRFIATGNFSGIFSSKDGDKWTKHRTVSSSNAMQAIAWNGTKAIAVEPGYIFQSYDLENWSLVMSSDANWTSVTWAGDRFIAVASNAKSGVSFDGSSWTTYNAPLLNTKSIAWSGTIAYSSQHYTSDGATWFSSGGDFPGSNAIGHEAMWDGNKFLLGGTTFLGVSYDGNTASRILNTIRDIGKITVTPTGYYSVIAPSSVYAPIHRSADGIQWSGEIGKLPRIVTGMASSGKQLMAVTSNGHIFTSPEVDSDLFYTHLRNEGYSPEMDLSMNADSNNDGIANVIAYVTGISLSNPTSQFERTRLPHLQKKLTGGHELKFTLSNENLPWFLQLTVESSVDLHHWETFSQLSSSGIWSNPSTSDQFVGGKREVSIAIPSVAESLYFRLSVKELN